MPFARLWFADHVLHGEVLDHDHVVVRTMPGAGLWRKSARDARAFRCGAGDLGPSPVARLFEPRCLRAVLALVPGPGPAPGRAGLRDAGSALRRGDAKSSTPGVDATTGGRSPWTGRSGGSMSGHDHTTSTGRLLARYTGRRATGTPPGYSARPAGRCGTLNGVRARFAKKFSHHAFLLGRKHLLQGTDDHLTGGGLLGDPLHRRSGRFVLSGTFVSSPVGVDAGLAPGEGSRSTPAYAPRTCGRGSAACSGSGRPDI